MSKLTTFFPHIEGKSHYDENTHINAYMAERGYRDCEIERELWDNADGELPAFRWVHFATVDLSAVKTIGDIAELSDVLTLRANDVYKGGHVWEKTPLSNSASLSYGQLERLSQYDKTPLIERDEYTGEFERLVYVPDLLSGSDYSGGSLQASNFRVFKDSFKATQGQEWWELYGGHGTYAIAIALNCHNADMVDFLKDLADYPVADEDDMSELENEAESEAWENWIRSDFTRELKKHFNEDTIDELTDAELREIFTCGMDRANEYYEHETGGGVFVRLEKVAAALTLEEIENGGDK